MFIGLDCFGTQNALVFDKKVYHSRYDKLQIFDGMIDQIFITEDITVPCTIEKPDGWDYSTVVNAKFQNSLEGGSIEAGGIKVEKIRFQKRRWDELEWQDVAEIEYDPEDKLYYEAIDKYVAHDFIYQYSIVPITSTVVGSRVISDEITVKFDSVFLSDRESNYALLYDVELSDIESNTPTALFEPMYRKYPIVAHSNLDYDTFDIEATFISAETVKSNGNIVNIRMERLGKDKLMQFMKNGKPKIYRDYNGNIKLVAVYGKPVETPSNDINGISKLSFSLVEIGDIDSETLRINDMLEGLSGVF